MTRVIATFNNTSVDGADPKHCSIHSDYVIPKTLPHHFGTTEYTFSSNPTNTDFDMFSIDFSEFDYVPMGFLIMEETTDSPGSFSLVVSYTIFQCFNIEPLPPFRSSTTLQYIYADVDRSDKKINVKYHHEHNTDAGYTGTVCPQVNVNGKKYTFRYYIFVEGDDDEEMITVNQTI